MTPGADLRRDVQEEDGRAMAGLFGGADGRALRAGGRGNEGRRREKAGAFCYVGVGRARFQSMQRKESQESGVSETSHGVM